MYHTCMTKSVKQLFYLILNELTLLIIYMKKLLDSDWLGAVQFKCNTMQITMVILNYDLLKDNRKLFKPMRSSKTMTKSLYRTVEKSFSNAKKGSLQFLFILLISYTFFLIQFQINLHCEFFKKLKFHLSKWLRQFQLFEKLTHANYINFKFNLKLYDYLYKLYTNILSVILNESLLVSLNS